MGTTARVPDWVQLSPEEEVVWSGHPTVYYVAESVFTGTVLVIVGLLVAGGFDRPLALLGGLLVIGGLLVGVWGYIRRQSTRYVITTAEVYRKTGLLSRRVSTVRLDRVQNTGFTQSVRQRLLSYGDVRIETAGTGATEIVLSAVADPQRVNSILTEQLDTLSTRGQRRPTGE